MRYSRIFNMKIGAISIFLMLGCFAHAQDGKSILERKTAIHVSGELLDPFFDFYDGFKLAGRVNIGLDYKVGQNAALGGKVLLNKFKSYPHSAWEDTDPYTLVQVTGDFGTTTDTIPLIRRGYTKGRGFELSFKKFRKKRQGFYPAGLYYEFGIGFHKTTFTGFHYTTSDFNNNTDRYELREVNEPERSATSMSLAFKLGKQWVMDNFLYFGYGMSFRAHVPIKPLDEPPGVDYGTGIQTMYNQDVFGAEWFTTYVSLGYLL